VEGVAASITGHLSGPGRISNTQCGLADCSRSVRTPSAKRPATKFRSTILRMP